MTYQQEEVLDKKPNRNTFVSLKEQNKGKKQGIKGQRRRLLPCAYAGSRPYGLDSLAPWEDLIDIIPDNKAKKRHLHDTSTPKIKIKRSDQVDRRLDTPQMTCFSLDQGSNGGPSWCDSDESKGGEKRKWR